MPFHHLAVTCRDLAATHRFYTEAMRFELVKANVAPTPEGGWAKHLFYDTGNGEMFAVWEIHDDRIGTFDPALATGLGLPLWSNHVAFAASSIEDLHDKRDHWLSVGVDCAEIDHGWCRSIYATDPSGLMVEFCVSTEAFTEADRAEALALLGDEDPTLEAEPTAEFFLAPR